MFSAPLHLRVRNALVSANFHSWDGIDHAVSIHFIFTGIPATIQTTWSAQAAIR
jgi:hypothetical protein